MAAGAGCMPIIQSLGANCFVKGSDLDRNNLQRFGKPTRQSIAASACDESEGISKDMNKKMGEGK